MKNTLSQREMFEISFKRPRNFFELPTERKWQIDKDLGILDWDPDGLSPEDVERYKKHYEKIAYDI